MIQRPNDPQLSNSINMDISHYLVNHDLFTKGPYLSDNHPPFLLHLTHPHFGSFHSSLITHHCVSKREFHRNNHHRWINSPIGFSNPCLEILTFFWISMISCVVEQAFEQSDDFKCERISILCPKLGTSCESKIRVYKM